MTSKAIYGSSSCTFFWKQLTASKRYGLVWVEQLKMKTNWLALGYPKYLEWNLLWYNFCTNFAQRETLTNVHPAATAAVARKLCNFFSFAFHPQTSVATTTYCCYCSMNAVERKFHMIQSSSPVPSLLQHRIDQAQSLGRRCRRMMVGYKGKRMCVLRAAGMEIWLWIRPYTIHVCPYTIIAHPLIHWHHHKSCKWHNWHHRPILSLKMATLSEKSVKSKTFSSA